MLMMYATLEGKLNGMDFKEYKNTGKSITFPGFCFRCKVNGEDKSVDFDWDSSASSVQEDGGLLLVEGEETWYGRTGELDDIFDLNYEENGFSRSDLTAEVLASTSEIEEFSIDYDIEAGKCNDDYLHITSITFVDDTGSYTVSGEVLDRFNGMELVEKIQPVGDLGMYDRYDESLMDYPNESDLSYAEYNNELDEEELPF